MHNIAELENTWLYPNKWLISYRNFRVRSKTSTPLTVYKQISYICNSIAARQVPTISNQLMAIQSSSGFSLLWPGSFHMFYKYITNIIYITETGRKKNKQARTWIGPNRKKGEIWGFFWHSVFLCCHERVLEQNSYSDTRKADSSSCADRPGLWLHKSKLLLQQLPLSDRCLYVTVGNSPLLLTALGPCLYSSCSSLLGNITRKLFVWASHQSRQRDPLTSAHPHPYPQKRMPTIVPHISFEYKINNKIFTHKWYIYIYIYIYITIYLSTKKWLMVNLIFVSYIYIYIYILQSYHLTEFPQIMYSK